LCLVSELGNKISFLILPYFASKATDKTIANMVEIIIENNNSAKQLKIRHLCLQNPSKQKQKL
jgi:hypothetical protein